MSGSLLLVSDSVALLSDVQRTLQDAGFAYSVQRVSTEPEFLGALEKASPATVIADCRCAALDGRDVLRLLRLRNTETPLILLHDVIEEQDVVEAIRSGANQYLSISRLARLGPAIAAELHDATARRERARLQETLRKTEERYRLLVEQAPTGICVVGRDLRFAEVNDRFCQIVGYARHELIGRPLQDISHPDDIAMARARIALLFTGEATTAAFERRYIRKNGGEVWAHVRLAVTHDRDGKPETVVGTVEETSEQHEAFAQLTLQRRLIDSVQEAVIATDLQGHVIYWNHFAEGLYGWPAADAMGRSIYELTPSDQVGETAHRS